VLSGRQVIDEFMRLVESRDDRAFDLVAADFVNHAAGPQGCDGLRQTMAALEHDFDELSQDVHRVIADVDQVVVHLTLTGTHRASAMPLLAGLPVSGRQVAWTFIHIWRVEGGLIVEHWVCRDDVGLLAQLGAWPAS
jgi:lactoylglutathione lyase